MDIIKFGEGVTKEDIIISRQGNDLVINFHNNSQDSVTIKNQFINQSRNTSSLIEELQFHDDSKLDLRSVMVLTGSNNNDIIVGGMNKNNIDYIYAFGGNDSVYGGLNNDVIYGGSGNDFISGEWGNDLVHGGQGADLLYGGSGADSFDFSSLEDSSINAIDTIEDFEQGTDKINLSQIEENLSFDSFEFTVENGHTIIKDKNSDFAIDLSGQFNLNEDDFIF